MTSEEPRAATAQPAKPAEVPQASVIG
jgi:hypothetical protein